MLSNLKEMIWALTLSKVSFKTFIIVRGGRLGDKYTPVIQKALKNLKNIKKGTVSL